MSGHTSFTAGRCVTRIVRRSVPTCQWRNERDIKCDRPAPYQLRCNGELLGDYCMGHATAAETRHHQAHGRAFSRPLWDDFLTDSNGDAFL